MSVSKTFPQLAQENSSVKLDFHTATRADKAFSGGLLLAAIPLAIGIISLLSHLHVTHFGIPSMTYGGAIGLTGGTGIVFLAGVVAVAVMARRHHQFKNWISDLSLNHDQISAIKDLIKGTPCEKCGGEAYALWKNDKDPRSYIWMATRDGTNVRIDIYKNQSI